MEERLYVKTNITVNSTAVENHAGNIQGISDYFTGHKLENADHKSTIRACSQVRLSYQGSQRIIRNFGKSMDREVSNIRSIGATFRQYDETLKSLITEK